MTEDEIFDAVRLSIGPDALPPASPEAVAEAEEAIGYPLPPLLRRLYLEVANGGFGPRGGIIGVRGYDFHNSDIFADIVESAVAFRAEPGARCQGMVQLLDWGCGIASLLDCRDPAGAMWGWDSNICCMQHALFRQDITFNEWLAESIGREYDEPFYNGYFADGSTTESGTVELISGGADHEGSERSFDCSPLIWVNGRLAT